jgi:hypothetical protein
MACIDDGEDRVFECGPAAANRDRLFGHLDLIHDETQVSAAQCRILLAQAAAYGPNVRNGSITDGPV